MSTKAAVQKPMAAILAVLLATAALVLSPLGATASHAATLTPRQVALLTLNLDRLGSSPLEAFFGTNGFVDDTAQAAAANFAACSGCVNPVVAGLSGATGTTTTHSSYAYVQISGGVVADRPGRIANDFYNNWQLTSRNDDGYASIGMVTKGSTVYAALVSIDFAATPIDETRAGTVTLPSKVHVGVAITPSIKGFSPAPSPGYEYTWENGVATVGTGATYTPTSNDLGKRIKLLVTEHNTGFSPVTVTSAQTGSVGVGTPHAGTYAVTGARNVGQTLTVHDSGTGWLPQTPTAQWYRNGVKVVGQTGATYVQTIADLGKRIDVKVTETAIGYTSLTKGTATTAKTGYPLLTTVPSPSSDTNPIFISGLAQYQQTLAAQAGTWGPGTVTLKYQWRSNGAAISGATHATLLLGASLVGTAISVTVTGSEAGFASASATSYPTTDVARIHFSSTGSPTITGTFAPGKTVTAHVGSWVPAPTIFAYQWFVNGVAVTGAYQSTYKLPASAVSVYVEVVGLRPSYQSVRVQSGTYGV